MQVFCDICHKPIALNYPHYHQEIGWVRPRSGGGTNGLTMRQETGKRAHIECVDLAKRKISHDQGALL